MKISKNFSFDAAHRLTTHNGKCRNLHGHRYSVIVTIEGDISSDSTSPTYGMVKDFNELAIFKEWINNNLDHTYIGNATDPITLQCQQEGLKVYIIDHASTAEYLAQHLYEVFSTMMPIASIQLFETPTASVVYP